MWNHIEPRNLIALQRIAALQAMKDECTRLLAEGYPIEADRVLDEIAERKRLWSEE